MKILVAIANFGTKNEKYLKRLIEEYRSMTGYYIDIAILSNIPKDLGPDLEVIVGLPTKDPWSLPFGHKILFADRLNKYDLFIYSEDDTLITERNIDAFCDATRMLPDSFIAGFLRYEVSADGTKYYSTIHGHYHWDPDSVRRFGEYVFAHYTNEHSACFILTREQLRKAIDSGGFLLPPRKGRYDMLVTAATDPYTQCGMKKLVCISHLDDFCLHHLPNVYCGRIGIESGYADLEINALKSWNGNETARGPLFETTTRLDDATWDKKFYEHARKDILSLVPGGVRKVLSIGCGDGTTEDELLKRNVEVTGIPLDRVIQASAAARGIRVLPPDFDEARHSLQGERFDCILFPDVLHHVPDPVSVLTTFLPMLKKDGAVIVSVPDFHHPSVLWKRLRGEIPRPNVGGPRSFDRYGIQFTTRRMLSGWLKACGLRVVSSYRPASRRNEGGNRSAIRRLKSMFPRNVVVLCRRDR